MTLGQLHSLGGALAEDALAEGAAVVVAVRPEDVALGAEGLPVVVTDAVAIRSMMNICMSFDHRINDGAESGGFLMAVKSRLESMGPDTPIY